MFTTYKINNFVFQQGSGKRSCNYAQVNSFNSSIIRFDYNYQSLEIHLLSCNSLQSSQGEIHIGKYWGLIFNQKVN